MHSFSTPYLESITFSAADAQALRRLGEARGRQELFSKQRPEVLEDLRTTAIIESSESSNRLEGIEAPQGRVRALALQDTTPQNRSEQEIAGYRDVLKLIHASATDMPFSASIVRQLHQKLFAYLPQDGGEWKMTNNEIVERDFAGNTRIRFVPVEPVLVPGAMQDLTQGYQEAVHSRQQDALVLVPLAILDFLCIHPFTDGNGRIARLLTLLLLYQFDYRVGGFISLERLFEESRETYYETLEKSSVGWHDSAHDVFPWLRYFWGVLIKAYDEFETRVETITEGRGSKTAQVRSMVGRMVEPFAISELHKLTPGVSKEMVRHVLRKMREEGLVRSRGRGPAARWIKIE